MNKSMTINCLILLVGVVFAADEVPKLLSADQAVLDKAVDANLTEANKTYIAYQAAIAKAQDQVVKALEKVKTDAMKKGNLPLANAADARIKEVKDGSLLLRATEPVKGDLLGDAVGGDLFKTSKDILAYLAKHPKWKGPNGRMVVFDLKQMKAATIEGGKVTYNETITQDKTVIHYGGCKFDFAKSDGKTIVFIWPKGEMESLILADGE